jgi:hypothetical protein
MVRPVVQVVVPTLGGHMPADYLDTFEWQKILHTLLGSVVSGTYV